jgi:monoamine oxidase
MHDAIILGAGLSGLAAARKLDAAGLSFLVIEARDRVGGRVLTQGFAGGYFDLGAQWIGPGQVRMNALCQELGVETFPTYHSGRNILDYGGKVRSYKGTIPSLPPLALLELELTIRRLEALVREESPDLAAPDQQGRDRMTVGQWLDRHIWSAHARTTVTAAVRVIYGEEPESVSLLHFLRYAKAGGTLMQLCEIEGGAQQDRVVGGMQGLATQMAGGLGDRLVLSTPVRAVRWDEEGVEMVCDGCAYRARKAIFALPPPALSWIRFEPGLPRHRQELNGRSWMSSTIKCIAVYGEPFWREAGFSGEAVSDGSPITVAFDNTTFEGLPALLAFVVGAPAREWGARPRELKEAVLSRFASWFGPQAADPVDYLQHDWATEEWTRGCPISVSGPMTHSIHGAALRAPVGSLHWAGTETATEWMGFMEGAIQAGERAAGELL